MTDKQAYLKAVPDISDDFISVPSPCLIFKIHGSITYTGTEDLDGSQIWAEFLSVAGVSYGGYFSSGMFDSDHIQFEYSDGNLSSLSEWCRKLWNEGYLEYGKKDGGLITYDLAVEPMTVGCDFEVYTTNDEPFLSLIFNEEVREHNPWQLDQNAVKMKRQYKRYLQEMGNRSVLKGMPELATYEEYCQMVDDGIISPDLYD